MLRPTYTVKTESLRTDLARLVESRLRDSIKDIPAALHFIEKAPARNVTTVQWLKPEIDAEMKRRLREREWLLYEAYSY